MFKRGQITLFVIIAILIIAAVAAVIILKPPIPVVTEKIEAKSYIESCMKEDAGVAAETISIQGGTLNPASYVDYYGNKASYLCYTSNNYEPCVNQKTMLKQSIENELNEYLKGKVSECASRLKLQLENRGYIVGYKEPAVDTKLHLGAISIVANLSFKAEKGEEILQYETFETSLANPLYDFVILANEIVNDEVESGDFNVLYYEMFNRDIRVDQDNLEMTVYTLTHKNSGKKFIFAVRSWTVPPGLI